MPEWSSALLTFFGGAAGAALVAGIFSLVQSRLARKDELEDMAADKAEDAEDRANSQEKALRYLMLYIIQERAKSHIKDKKITLEERRSLHHWHTLYHDGLGGNGDADALMAQVDKLPVDLEE